MSKFVLLILSNYNTNTWLNRNFSIILRLKKGVRWTRFGKLEIHEYDWKQREHPKLVEVTKYSTENEVRLELKWWKQEYTLYLPRGL